jgi:hypothetical protein
MMGTGIPKYRKRRPPGIPPDDLVFRPKKELNPCLQFWAVFDVRCPFDHIDRGLRWRKTYPRQMFIVKSQNTMTLANLGNSNAEGKTLGNDFHLSGDLPVYGLYYQGVASFLNKKTREKTRKKTREIPRGKGLGKI